MKSFNKIWKKFKIIVILFRKTIINFKLKTKRKAHKIF